MITTETVFRTSDGRLFPTVSEAEQYEKLLQIEATAQEFAKTISKSKPLQKIMTKAIVAWEAR